MGEADWEVLRCRGDIQRQWRFGGTEPEVLPVDPEGDAGVGEQRGMFYERGDIQFHIASGRRRVLLTYSIGPRYGRGMELAVHGQGKKGKLIPSGQFSWQS